MEVTTWKNLTQSSDSCSIIDMDYSMMTASNSLFDYLKNSTLQTLNYTNCNNFEFSGGETDGKTLVEEFSLVCSRRQLLSVVEMCFLAGAAVGSVSSGWISDRFGRKHTLMGFALIQTIFGKNNCRSF